MKNSIMRAISRDKMKGPAGSCHYQPSLFDSSVIVARQPSSIEVLCPNTLARIKRQAMQPEQKIRRTYRQEWAAYNQAQTNEKSKFQELLYALCQNVEDLPRKQGAGRNRLPLGQMIY